MNDKPTILGVDVGQSLPLKHARCPLAVIKGLAAWATPSLALRFDAAAQTLPYMIRPPKERAKPNGGRRQRLRMRR